MAAEVVQRFEVQLEAGNKHQLVLRSARPEIWGMWDPTRLDQVLTNLVGNATKYSQAGSEVAVGIETADHEVLISVSDRGLGIPRQQQDRVFEPFFRAGNVAGLPVEGTGLGLHITREIVRRHQGRIWFESDEGKGTTFFVELPLSPPA